MPSLSRATLSAVVIQRVQRHYHWDCYTSPVDAIDKHRRALKFLLTGNSAKMLGFRGAAIVRCACTGKGCTKSSWEHVFDIGRRFDLLEPSHLGCRPSLRNRTLPIVCTFRHHRILAVHIAAQASIASRHFQRGKHAGQPCVQVVLS